MPRIRSARLAPCLFLLFALLFASCSAVSAFAAEPAAPDTAAAPKEAAPAPAGETEDEGVVLGPREPEPEESMEEAMALLQKSTDEYAEKLMKEPPEGMSEGDVALVFGNLYGLGVLGAPDDAKAKKYLEIALEKGIPDAGVALGALLLSGPEAEDHVHVDGDEGTHEHPLPSEADIAKALEYYRNAAAAGSVDGMRILGRLLADGENGVKQDRAEGEKYLLMAARNGDDYSLDRLEDKFKEAAEWEKNNPGKTSDFPASREAAVDQALVAKNAARNERLSRNIGVVYKGLEKVLYQAMGLDYDAMNERREREDAFTAAFAKVAREAVAEDGDRKRAGETAFAVGAMYSFGLAGMVDLDQAELFYSMAADRGMTEAWAALGELYAGGVPDMHFMAKANTARALEYYQKAVDAGVSRAMYALGELYRAGREDLPADQDKAIAYFKRAAEWGDEDAVKALDEIIAATPEADRAAKGLPAEAKSLVDEKKAQETKDRIVAIQGVFERSEKLLRERLEKELGEGEDTGPEDGPEVEADAADAAGAEGAAK